LVLPQEPDRRVVGVVEDLIDSPTDRPEPRIFVPLGDPQFRRADFVVRAAGALDTPAFRETLLARTGAAALTFSPDATRIAGSLRQPRIQAIVFGLFAGITMLVAAVGLYATSAFEVASRRREMGIRLSLGASPGQIRRLVIVDALRPVIAGTVLGLGAAYWAAQFMQTLLHDVDARDPWTQLVVAALLVVTAVIAAWIPARRAARVDPVKVLRST
jgi:ABC-type antimicrobial peptide transport system permease subunit